MRILAALMLAGVPAGALAASESDFSVTETREAVYDYAKCVTKRSHDRAAEVILKSVDNADVVRRYRRLISGDCLLDATPQANSTVELRLAGDQFHYALADALVTADLADVAPRDMTLVAPLEHRAFDPADYEVPAGKKLSKRRAEEQERSKARALASIYLSRFGECVVRSDPAASKALLMARPTTAEEAAAFTALGSVLGGCVEAGQEFTASKAMLRGTIAINYYRLAMAPQLPAPEVSQ